MPFWVASSDVDGVILPDSIVQLAPGPADVDYPLVSAGRVVDTSAGSRIKQTPPSDPRPRAWIWENLPTYRPAYVRLVHLLESLLGTTRRQRGLSPWIFLKDTESDQLRVWQYIAGTGTSAGASTFTDTAQAWPAQQLDNAVIEIAGPPGTGQRRAIVSHTTDTLTLDAPWTTIPTGAAYNIQYQGANWIRCRVLNVSKKVAAKRSITYETVRMEFAISDDTFDDLG